MTLSIPHPAPQKIFCPRRFAKKVGGHGRANPWIISVFDAKSLIPEAVGPTGRPPFSTGLPPFSTVSPVFSTGRVFGSTLSFSLYPIDKKEEEREGSEVNQGTLIHGFEQLPIFSSTGFPRVPRVFRGNPWKCFACISMAYVAKWGDPRIHGKKCLGVLWKVAKCAI
jgi:hypothetical protein